MSDYPDHLNPFKRSTGLRESFRSLKRSIEVRFRKKDHSKNRASATHSGTLLRHDGRRANGTNGVQMPRSETIIGATGTSEMLPRSRFNERVPRANTMDLRSGRNPFDDEDNAVNAKVGVNGRINGTDGSDTAKRRRRKKRAPLPPGVTSLLAIPGDQSNSQWSINSCTSYETDYSTTGYTHSENEDGQSDNAERLKDIQEISKEIQVFCDSGEQVDEVEECSKQEQIVPEEVPQEENVSTHEASVTVAIVGEEDGFNGESLSVGEHKVVVEENAEKTPVSPGSPKNAIEIREVKINGDTSFETGIEAMSDICKGSDTTQENEQSQIEVPNDEINNNIYDNASTESCDGSPSKPEATDALLSQASQDKTTNTFPSNLANPPGHAAIDELHFNTEKIAYVDRKSIYIEGPTDGLLNKTQTSLYITGSTDQLDSTDVPRPKMRKHKLGREQLLGSNDEGLDKSSEKQ